MPNLESLAALGDFFWNTPWSSWQCHVPSRSYSGDTKATLSKMAGQLVRKKRIMWKNCCVFECWVVEMGKQENEKAGERGNGKGEMFSILALAILRPQPSPLA